MFLPVIVKNVRNAEWYSKTITAGQGIAKNAQSAGKSVTLNIHGKEIAKNAQIVAKHAAISTSWLMTYVKYVGMEHLPILQMERFIRLLRLEVLS